jgi:hypothetical protein
LVGVLGMRNCYWIKNLGVIHWDLMAFCDRQLYYFCLFVFCFDFALH